MERNSFTLIDRWWVPLLFLFTLREMIILRDKNFGLGSIMGFTNFAKASKATNLANMAKASRNTARAENLNKIALKNNLIGGAKLAGTTAAAATIGGGAYLGGKALGATKDALSGEMGQENGEGY